MAKYTKFFPDIGILGNIEACRKRMRRYPLFLLLVLAACSSPVKESTKPSTLPAGTWRLQLNLGEGLFLPFCFTLSEENSVYTAEIINGSEKIRTEQFSVTDDSVFFRLPVFDSEFKMKRNGDHTLEGTWFNYSKSPDYKIPAFAEYNKTERFTKDETKGEDASFKGKWKVTFSKGSEEQYMAVGLFEQEKDIVTGTFITETGDYRYLEGRVNGNTMQLSCFDGSHAFYFTATLLDTSSIDGMFYSGTHWKEPWVAVRDDAFELSDPESLTYIKEGYSGLEFSFPDIDNNTVSFPSAEYSGKVTIVELMGSWCPNCMDETGYLKSLYDIYHPKGLEIISLCFERTSDFASSARNIRKHKTHLGADWKFLVAGTAQKEDAAAALPMLNHVMSYPTTIFIDKKGQVRKIYTGFYGPGTGQYYERYAEKNQLFLETLLAE